MLRGIRAESGDAITRTDSEPSQCSGQSRHAFCRFAIAPAPDFRAVESGNLAVGVNGCAVPKQRVHGQRPILHGAAHPADHYTENTPPFANPVLSARRPKI